MYSPILADKWSCGRVLLKFTERLGRGEDDKGLRIFARQLMNDNPNERPPLLEWGAPLKRKGAEEGSEPSTPTISRKRHKVDEDTPDSADELQTGHEELELDIDMCSSCQRVST